MRKLVGLAVVLAVATSAPADVLWDNNIRSNGSDSLPISPPTFPNIRVADDFVVPQDSNGWFVQDIHYSGIEDATWVWNDGDGIEVFVYEDTDGDGPGMLIETRVPGGTKMATGRSFFSRAEYEYWAEFENDPVTLGPGTYWVGMRHPTAGGIGTNYWLTSDGGPDGKESSAAYASIDSGRTWRIQRGQQYAFILTGREIPEPTTLALLALAGLAVLRRRTAL